MDQIQKRQRADKLDDLVSRWIDGDLEAVVDALAGYEMGFYTDFLTLLIKERHERAAVLGDPLTLPRFTYDCWKDLARLAEMLGG